MRVLHLFHHSGTKRLLPILGFLVAILFSCTQEEQVSYMAYFVEPENNGEFIALSFEFTELIAEESDRLRTIPVDSTGYTVWLGLKSGAAYLLGQDAVKPETIQAYYLDGLGDFKLYTQNDTLDLKPVSGDYPMQPLPIPAGFKLEHHRNHTMTLYLDVEKSVTLDSAGEDWIRPHFRAGLTP